MNRAIRFFIIDDDPVSVGLMTRILESSGHIVASSLSGRDVVRDVIGWKPDCLLLDIMMPDKDGIALCRELRQIPALDRTKIVMVTAKTYDSDRSQAFRHGADGYITKPVDPDRLLQRLEEIIEDRIEMTFWGVRGTLPVPGPEAVKFGGNTSCVSLKFAKGQMFILDAGTGIKALSDHLARDGKRRLRAKILISHPHWDHINALPFFLPLYLKGNEFDIFGPAHGDRPIKDVIFGQMDGIHFPIKTKAFSAHVRFHELREQTFTIEGIHVRTMLLNHPGYCLGYRIEYGDRTISYITDNELYPKTSGHFDTTYEAKLVDFIRDSHALIMDSTYTEDEYNEREAWGHSSVQRVVEIADQANVRTLYLFHHDPDQTDRDIAEKLRVARKLLKSIKSKTSCVAPKERETFLV